jgi:hypothetical protein
MATAEGETRPDDPYADLENVFDEPIVLEEADLQSFESEEIEAPIEEIPETPVVEAKTEPEPLPQMGGRISESGMLARLEALEAEVRAGSERTLEALRRLGERVGTELAMLDKRAINLELTIARLRSVLEGSGTGARRVPDPPSTDENGPETAE